MASQDGRQRGRVDRASPEEYAPVVAWSAEEGAVARELGTYQMLWDCGFCGAEKLLGLTHRHCPSCGAPQDPARRYFPSEADKVAVEDHRFTGADKVCANCQTPNGAAATHCGNCGSPLDEAKAAATHAAREASAGAGKSLEAQQKEAKRAAMMAANQPPAPPKKKGRGCLILGCLGALAVLLVILVSTLWTRESTFEVTGHTWSRVVTVERFGPDQASGWCDSMPGGAYDVSRTEKERSTNKVPDGEECVTKQVDNGDGTFREVEECKTKYRSEPVYDDWCTYSVDRWNKVREEKASGKGLSPEWPAVRLGQTGQCVGCEREGAREGTYTVRLKDPQGEQQNCDLPEDRWRAMAEGSRWAGEVRVLTGGLDCGELKPAR